MSKLDKSGERRIELGGRGYRMLGGISDVKNVCIEFGSGKMFWVRNRYK